jgi:hypothetical protein
MNTRHFIITLLLAGIASSDVFAGDPAGTSDGWKQSAVIYLLAPTIRGTAGIGPLDADVDIDPKAVFSNLDAAFLGVYLAEKERWGVYADVILMNLEADLEAGPDWLTGTAANRQFNAALGATYRISEHWQLLAGGMYTDLKLTLDVDRPLQSNRRQRSESWIDPFVGARFATDLNQAWSFSSLGYVGGFGVGSDLMWTLNASFTYSFSERWRMVLGYRYIDFDYEEGSGLQRFRFDVAEHGPAAGLRFDF